MTSLQTSFKQPHLNLIEAPRLLVIMALLSILAEDVFKWSLPYLVKAEIKALIQYDITRQDLRQVIPIVPMFAVFTAFYILFLVSEIWS